MKKKKMPAPLFSAPQSKRASRFFERRGAFFVAGFPDSGFFRMGRLFILPGESAETIARTGAFAFRIN
jgi:hypothetical protein